MQNTHVDAFSYADTWDVIVKNVKEGGVYVIQDFAVKDATGVLKPVSSTYTIRFNNGTNIESTFDNSMIPMHKYEFLDLADLHTKAAMYEPNKNLEYAACTLNIFHASTLLYCFITFFFVFYMFIYVP